MSLREPDWDHDFRRGQQGELFVARIIEGLQKGTTETKTDDRAAETGNLYLETECCRLGAYQPSGLMTTKADVWCFVVGDLVLGVLTDRLRAMLFRLRPAECTAGSHPTRGHLLPISQLIAVIRQAAVATKEAAPAGTPPL